MVGAAAASSPRLLVLEADICADGCGAELRCVRADDSGTPDDGRWRCRRRRRELRIVLRGAWATTPADVPNPGDVVRVVLCDGSFEFRPWSIGIWEDRVVDDDGDDNGDVVVVVVDDDSNLLVRHPDVLVAGSMVADSFICRRKAVLTARNTRGVGRGVSPAALNGSMIHDLFQAVIVLASRGVSRRDDDGEGDGALEPLDVFTVSAAVEDVLSAHVLDIYAAGMPAEAARELLMGTLPSILDWAAAFLGPDAAVPVQDGKVKRTVAVDGVRDIEELVWSPIFGIKGKLDATVLLREIDERSQGSTNQNGARHNPSMNGGRSGCVVAPLELKTGSAVGYAGVSHHAQVILYALLMSDRCDEPVKRGLLSYIRPNRIEKLQASSNASVQAPSAEAPRPPPPKQPAFSDRKPSFRQNAVSEGDLCDRGTLVSIVRAELVGLVMQRNALAGYLLDDADIEDLPPMVEGRPSLCDKCFANDSCMIQHRMLEGGTGGSSDSVGPDPSLFLEKAAHLSEADARYYTFWRRVMAAEEAVSGGKRAELWAMGASAREDAGRCFADLELCDSAVHLPTDLRSGILLPGASRMAFAFRRAKAASQCREEGVTSAMTGEYILISVQKWSRTAVSDEEYWANDVVVPAVASGFLNSVSGNEIVVSVDRDLRYWASCRNASATDLVWRIDMEEIVASYNTAKSTLESLFVNEGLPGKAEDKLLVLDSTRKRCGMMPSDADLRRKMRRLIVELDEPRFRSLSNEELHNVDVQISMLATRGMQMNAEQRRALRMSVEAKDYVLLLGMPGTGKTATLAAIVIAAAARNQSVLVCSHTRTAVDNVLSRLLDLGFTDFVRVGQKSATGDTRIDDRHIDICDGTTVGELEKRLESPAVVATTCLGINHAVFSRRTSFDVVLVDEASQILQPICIGPLLLSSHMFVLVGDHYQLPPLVRSSTTTERRPRAEPAQMNIRGSDMRAASPAILSTDRCNPQESLFRRLCEAHPSAVVSLVKQYRMAHEIMHLSNSLVYSGSLACGTNDVAYQTLALEMDAMPGSSPKWLKEVLEPERRLLFLDTDGLNISDRESNVESVRSAAASNHVSRTYLKANASKHAFSRENVLEARVIAICVSALVRCGLDGKCIAVLTPFRAQVGVLRSILEELSPASEDGETPSYGLTGGSTPAAHLASGAFRAVDVCTIDQYQGKDKSCVILSFVRINTARTVGPLLKDWRRINVAITRAKAKLVMVGSASTVAGGSHFLSSMMKAVREQAAVVPVDIMP